MNVVCMEENWPYLAALTALFLIDGWSEDGHGERILCSNVAGSRRDDANWAELDPEQTCQMTG